MALSQADFVTRFASLAGSVVAGLATTAEKTFWFNEGMHRLGYYYPQYDDITWSAADRSVALNSDFIQIEKVVYGTGVTAEEWKVWGSSLIIESAAGASRAGSARVYYWASWPEMSGAQASLLTPQGDVACLYYALHRFYKLLSSNRAYYKRYSTAVGQNAVGIEDLQAESDRYYQDYLDAREDIPPLPPVSFWG